MLDDAAWDRVRKGEARVVYVRLLPCDYDHPTGFREHLLNLFEEIARVSPQVLVIPDWDNDRYQVFLPDGSTPRHVHEALFEAMRVAPVCLTDQACL